MPPQIQNDLDRAKNTTLMYVKKVEKFARQAIPLRGNFSIKNNSEDKKRKIRHAIFSQIMHSETEMNSPEKGKGKFLVARAKLSLILGVAVCTDFSRVTYCLLENQITDINNEIKDTGYTAKVIRINNTAIGHEYSILALKDDQQQYQGYWICDPWVGLIAWSSKDEANIIESIIKRKCKDEYILSEEDIGNMLNHREYNAKTDANTEGQNYKTESYEIEQDIFKDFNNINFDDIIGSHFFSMPRKPFKLTDMTTQQYKEGEAADMEEATGSSIGRGNENRGIIQGYQDKFQEMRSLFTGGQLSNEEHIDADIKELDVIRGVYLNLKHERFSEVIPFIMQKLSNIFRK